MYYWQLYTYTGTRVRCIHVSCVNWFFLFQFFIYHMLTQHLWITFRDINIISSKVQGNSMSFHVWFSMENFKTTVKTH